MTINSLGDMAQTYLMQSRTTTIKNDIQRLTNELSSGEVSDVRTAIAGNTAYVSDLERNLTKMDGYDLATTEAGQFAEGMQTVLTRINDISTSMANTLIANAGSETSIAANTILGEADAGFSSIVGAMNTSIGGRSLLSGTATDTQPLASTEDILTALTTAISGASSVDDILLAAEAWFNDPTGFGSVAYQGSDTSLAPMTISQDNSVEINLRADDQVFRDILQNMAVLAIADDPALALTEAEQSEIFQKSTDKILSSQNAIIEAQAQVGFTQSKIEATSVRLSAERTSLEMAHNDLLASDPYEAAIELEQVQFQLESLFSITARMSQLSLVNFI